MEWRRYVIYAWYPLLMIALWGFVYHLEHRHVVQPMLNPMLAHQEISIIDMQGLIAEDIRSLIVGTMKTLLQIWSLITGAEWLRQMLRYHRMKGKLLDALEKHVDSIKKDFADVVIIGIIGVIVLLA